jgi:hypothetical protein
MMLDAAFLQKLVLLLFGAVISGFGIPYVLKRIDNRKLREQKLFEAELSRQSKLIDAQSTLLDEITRILWKWRYLAKGVVYYGARGDQKRYDAARVNYEDTVWGLLDEFRTEISRSRRLVSEAAFKNLDSLYRYVVHDLDQKVSNLVSGDTIDQTGCKKLANRFSDEVSAKLDDALFELASELRLTSRSLAP